MHVNDYCNHICDTYASLAYIESIALKAQARIYQASRLCIKKSIRQEYSASLCNKDILLLIVSNVMHRVKKKLN